MAYLPAILLAPQLNHSYVSNSNTYTSDVNGFIYNALAADIPGLTAQACTVIAPRNNASASSNPTASDDYTKLYWPGSLWENVSAQTLWMCTAMGSTPGTATWLAIAASAGTLIGNASSVTVVPTGSSTSRTLAQLFADQWNNVKTFGAVGDNSANDTTAIQNAWTAALANGSPIYFPPGRYKVTGLDFDVTSSAAQIPLILGAGSNRAIVDAGTSAAPALYYHSTAGNDGFFGGIQNIGFAGNWAGPVLKFCRDDFADAINACTNLNVNVKNSSSSASAIAVKVNYYLNSVFNNLIANTGGIGTGIALQLNQSAFNVFSGCSFSSSQTGVHITNGFNFTNRFDAPDIEVVNHCVTQDSTNGNGYNKFIGGQFVWNATTYYAITSSAGGALLFDSVNFAPSSSPGSLYTTKVVDPGAYVGVQVFGNYGDGTTPASGTPSTGTFYTNTTGQAQVVSFVSQKSYTVGITPVQPGGSLGAEYTQSVGGVLPLVLSMGSGTVDAGGGFTSIIRPGSKIRVTTASTTVNWVWVPLPV